MARRSWALCDVYLSLCSLGYEDCIPDGFYEAFGDFPELVDPGELPTLAALKHAQIIEGDLREVRALAIGSQSAMCKMLVLSCADPSLHEQLMCAKLWCCAQLVS
jgi:hypothetical protein